MLRGELRQRALYDAKVLGAAPEKLVESTLSLARG